MIYTFYNVFVNNICRYKYKVDSKEVISCHYSYYDKSYYIKYSYENEDKVTTFSLKDFEDIFPTFPYDKNALNIETANKIDSIEARVDKIEGEIVKLLTHVEAIMTVLQQRLPTDEPLIL